MRRQLLDFLIQTLCLTVLSRTLRRALHAQGLRFCVSQRRPLLRKANRKCRLRFEKRWVHLPVEFWRQYIFTDY